MKLRIAAAMAVLVLSALPSSAQNTANQRLAVGITRSLVKDLFQSNAVPYVQPMVTTINATSNARFYNSAHVPKKVDRPYFKVSVNGMVGFIRDDQKSYTPSLDLGTPSSSLLSDIGKYGTIDLVNRKFIINPNFEDTLGLATLLMREMLIETQKQGKFPLPSSAATMFGYQPDVRVYLPPTDTLLAALRSRADYQALIAAGGPGVDSALAGLLDGLALPPYLTLPPGVNMSKLIAAVPQLEIGSLFGTELLIRFIPPVEFDPNVGKFSFYGIGLKHSISQYFEEPPIEAAAQIVYQGTSLKNTVGFTESSLEADAQIWNANIHVSKQLFDFMDIYSGLNYERIDVTSTYSYRLPQEVLIALGLVPRPPDGEPVPPDDIKRADPYPQTSVVKAGDTNIKWTIGLAGQIGKQGAFGSVRFSLDYSVSRFNIFSGGVQVTL